MLAKAMGAELVMAPALHRNSFKGHMKNTKWQAAPAASLLDVEFTKAYWRDRGLLMHEARMGD